VVQTAESAHAVVPACWEEAHRWDAGQLPLSPYEQKCEHHLGLTVVNRYLESLTDWCGDSGDMRESWMRCGKANFPWGKSGLLCEAHNVTLDIARVSKHIDDTRPKHSDPHFSYRSVVHPPLVLASLHACSHARMPLALLCLACARLTSCAPPRPHSTT